MLAAVVIASAVAIWLNVRRPTSLPLQGEADEGTGQIANRADADFPEGGVTTMDDRPVDTGYRFRQVRLFPGCIAMLLKPSAQSVRVVGAEATFYRKPFDSAGVRVLDATNNVASAEIVLVASQPDWLKGTDFPTADEWSRIAGLCATGGLVALHIDARRLSRGRMKGILSEFRAAVGPYLMWCIGALRAACRREGFGSFRLCGHLHAVGCFHVLHGT